MVKNEKNNIYIRNNNNKMEQPLISIKNDNSVENKELDFRGPVVGFYSIVVGEELYDLNDHYSKPWVKEDKVVVRSPVEAGINIIAFVIISNMCF